MENSSFESNTAQSTESVSLLQSKENLAGSGEIVVPIGTTDKGDVFIQDLGLIPHLLVCGFSGAGKTSFVQAIITQIATKYTKEKAKFIIYDSKMVDYAVFNAMPHLFSPVESDGKKAVEILSRLSVEVQTRFNLFVDAAVKDLVSYNEKCVEKGNETLPYIFVILDDFSSLQLNYNIDEPLLDVLKNGRAVGIHFIIVTSMTSSKILKKDILSNVPCRIAFCVSTQADSRIAIGQNGAEGLNIPGELLFRWQNGLIKCQGIYMSDEEVDRSIKKLQRQSRKSIDVIGNMAAQIFKDSTSNQYNKVMTDDSLENMLLTKAIDIVLETGAISASMLQRRLNIGYARAAIIMDMIEERGIIGPFEGSMPRKVLITKEQWHAMQYGEDISLSKKAVETSDFPDEVATPVKTDDEKDPDIEMRDFAQFNFNGIGLYISDNQISITKKVMTKLGPGTSILSFNGKGVADLTYKKPGIFSRGYIQFRMKPKIDIVNNNSDLFTVTKDNLSDLLKIEFGSDVARTMKVFMTQISEDIGIPLTLL